MCWYHAVKQSHLHHCLMYYARAVLSSGSSCPVPRPSLQRVGQPAK